MAMLWSEPLLLLLLRDLIGCLEGANVMPVLVTEAKLLLLLLLMLRFLLGCL